MKNDFIKLAILMLSITAISSCSSNVDEQKNEIPKYRLSTSATYIINEGVEGNQIAGSLTVIDNKTWTTSQNMFASVNKRSLGLTPNDAIIYGNKMYIAVSAENTIEVVDKNTLKSIMQIKTTNLLGKDRGQTPRCLVGAGKYIFVTTYSGYVAAIDTATFALKNVYKVGAYPEGIDQNNGVLYVANSNLAKGNGSISEIELSSGTVTNHTNPLIQNPISVKTFANDLYVLDSGLYDPNNNYNQTGASVLKISHGNMTKLMDATMMAIRCKDGKPSKIYTINAPYTIPATPISYQVYDCTTAQSKTFTTTYVDSPAAMAVDSVTGYVYITSYKVNPDWGYADFSAPGFVNVYDENGQLLKTMDVGVGPTTIVFNYLNVPATI